MYHRVFTFLLLMVTSSFASDLFASPLDSIGVEYRNGEQYIIHKIKAKETYFGISRLYNVPHNHIIEANANKALKIGDNLVVPTGRKQPTTQATGTPPPTATKPELAPDQYTNYKVGKGETLYSISKRFMVTVETIKTANDLQDDTVKEGTLIKVPNQDITIVPPANVTIVEDVPETESVVVPEVPTNRYGIRETSERGVAVWIDNLSQDTGNMLALHKTAPVGTVVKITNPMTKLTTYVKIVGKFVDNAETQNAIIVISKSAASQIGVLDRRFQAEIAYGMPIE